MLNAKFGVKKNKKLWQEETSAEEVEHKLKAIGEGVTYSIKSAQNPHNSLVWIFTTDCMHPLLTNKFI